MCTWIGGDQSEPGWQLVVQCREIANLPCEFLSSLLPNGHDDSPTGDAEFLLKLLTLSGAVIGIFGVLEQRTHYNVFDHLHTILPFLTFEGPVGYLKLGANVRVLGPSQQPIALGAALVVILPFAVYFARVSGRRWWLAAVLLLVGAFASGSRTAVVMLTVEAIVFLCLKPAEAIKLWPALIPALAVVHVALPGTIGSLKAAFFPKGGLVAQQSNANLEGDYNPLLAGGRIRLIRPMLSEASQKPVFGEGYGTRITGFDSPDRNAPILDDQWLNNVLDVGFVGLAAWVWLMVRACRKLFGASRRAEEERDSWLFAALGAFDCEFRRRHAYVRRVQLHASRLHFLDWARFVSRVPQDCKRTAGVEGSGRAYC